MQNQRIFASLAAAMLAFGCGDDGTSGGAGGSGGAGAGGSGGGVDEACIGVDCNDDNPCTQDVCSEGTCSNPVAVIVTLMQVDGDCAENICDGSELISDPDANDVPLDDGNPCTDEVCMNGAPAHPALPDGTACGEAGVCVDGACAECASDAECGGALDQCAEGVCVDCDETGGCEAPATCNLATNTCE